MHIQTVVTRELKAVPVEEFSRAYDDMYTRFQRWTETILKVCKQFPCETCSILSKQRPLRLAPGASITLLFPCHYDTTQHQCLRYSITDNSTYNSIERDNNTAKVRGITKIKGEGIKTATADKDEVKALKALLEKEDEVSEKFEVYIPRKRRPHVILYNVEKELQKRMIYLRGY
ncbi:hypothetical protein AVEN_152915-1 [Araneus ventricosus]|uniref:Uncharacterized protein n=1 Tax=Araneus ventricosus TaxID=182803 RepID=A0A4Y2AFH3_ARAVE|nr:hypothetical protein AVEN_152915-1 [Araneus ventricosus]